MYQRGEWDEMKKIWLFNHYATNMFYDKGGRHYSFSENLIKNGYEPTIFCASTLHNTDKNLISSRGRYKTDICGQVPFVFVKASDYKGNGISRVLNMLSFFFNLFPVTKKIKIENGKPDVILASSVHPLTCIAGIFIAIRYKVPCIIEIRDLWPESIVALSGKFKRGNIIIKVLYFLEKWIYKKADKLIFTVEGGRNYIIEKGWDNAHGGPIDLSKIYHINNGVDLETFNYNKVQFTFNDADLDNASIFKAVYTGSIRKVNNLKILVDIARKIQNKGYDKVKIIVYGDGDHREYLEQYVKCNGINNIIFKGRVDKKYIPFILSKCDITILDLYLNDLYRFGISPNKLFDYFASGKPILSLEHGYDLIKKYQCGITIGSTNVDEIAKVITQFCDMDDNQIKLMSENALKAAKDYDFKVLTNKLIELF